MTNETDINGIRVIKPEHYPAGLCVATIGQLGVHLFDCETLESLYNFKAQEGDYLIQTCFIQSENIIVTGSQRGIIYLIDISNIQKLKDGDDDIVTKFKTLDAGIRALQVSPKPEERFLAIGTEKGTIHVYKKKFIAKKKPYKYFKVNAHSSWIRGFCFMEAGDDYLLASFSERGNLHVYCMKERFNIYVNDNIPNGVSDLIYNDKLNTLMIVTKKQDCVQFSLNFDDDFFDNYVKQLNEDLDSNIKRRFIRTNDQEVRHACLKHIDQNDILNFQRINLFSICAIMGRSESLQVAATRFDMWMGNDGQTLI